MYVHMRPYRILLFTPVLPCQPGLGRRRTLEGDGDSIIVLACLFRKGLSMMLVAFSAWHMLLAQGEREEKRAGQRVPRAEVYTRERSQCGSRDGRHTGDASAMTE